MNARQRLGFRLSQIAGDLRQRVRDFIGVFHYIGMTLYIGQFICCFTYFKLLERGYYTFIALYTLWLLYDRQTPHRGGRPKEYFRNMYPLQCIKHYFPLNLRKTAELPKERNYLFLCHPHGLLGIGACVTFGSDVTGFSEVFPGVKTVVASFRHLFMVPFMREYLLMISIVAASKASLEHVLSRPASSQDARSVALVVGGVKEMVEAYPGSLTLVLRDRKGFAKIALRSGADLVPVFTFGENELYTQLHDPTYGDNAIKQVLKRVLLWLERVSGFSFPLPTSFFPGRHPMDTLVGAPIKVEKTTNPTQEQVDRLHEEYMRKLFELFEEYKADYGYSPVQKLKFI